MSWEFFAGAAFILFIVAAGILIYKDKKKGTKTGDSGGGARPGLKKK